MVMKDKLIKNHHKGIYYKTRQFFVGTSVVLGVFALVAVPTYISINASIQTTMAQQQNNDDEDSEKEDLLSYSGEEEQEENSSDEE